MTESTENESIAHLQHQLRTPVNHVLGYSEILIDEATRRNLLGLVPAFEQIQAGGHQLLGSIQKAFNDEGGTASAPALDALGWRDFFRTIQAADMAPSKPHPGMLLQALEATGTRPESAVFIGGLLRRDIVRSSS